MNSSIQASKRLAYLLRHSTLPDHNGWVSTIVLIRKHNFTPRELDRIVRDDDKGRFGFSDDGLSVRALYGHSIDVDLELPLSDPPAVLYHGTAEKYIARIMKEGLQPRKRNYVHLSETKDMAKQVGTRHGNPVVLSVDVLSMAKDGNKFFKVQRGIWLAGCVPVKYIKIESYE